MHLIDELRRRNVHRIALGYIAGAWLLVQVVDTLSPAIGLSNAGYAIVVALLAVGFLPAVALAWIFEWTPEGLRRESEVPLAAARRETRTFDRVIIATLALAVVVFAVDRFVLDPARDRAAIEQAIATATIDRYADRSIVVLPFLNLSPDPDQAYFADGITEELLNLLADIDELRVISRSTSWTFKGNKVDIGRIRKKLDVTHVLEGSVRKAGDDVRITAQLIDARTDTHLWSGTYDRKLEDIFAIQDNVSHKVVDALEIELLADIPKAERIDPHAYERYLEARHIIHTLIDPTRYGEAERLLKRAIEIEPDYVPALWQLARIYERRRLIERDDTTDAYLQADIRNLVSRMRTIAPRSSYAQGWLAYIAFAWDKDWERAARHAEVAIENARDENLVTQLNMGAGILTYLGRNDEAIALVRFSVDRDPACTQCRVHLAALLRQRGRHEEAVDALAGAADWRIPNLTMNWTVGVAFLVAGEPERALEYFDRIEEEGQRELGKMLALASTGPPDVFEAEFARFRAENASSPEGVARVYAWSGQAEKAVNWLERTVETRGAEVIATVATTEFYEPISDEPAYQSFMARFARDDQASQPAFEFAPDYPPALQAAIDRELAGRDTKSAE